MFRTARAAGFGAALSLGFALCTSIAPLSAQTAGKAFDDAAANYARQLLKDGRRIFRYDTFGSEAFWGDALQLHKAIAGEKNGGVGPGVSPKTALSVGLKVDADALPDALKKGIKAGKVNLDDPATTLALHHFGPLVQETSPGAARDDQVQVVTLKCGPAHEYKADTRTSPWLRINCIEMSLP